MKSFPSGWNPLELDRLFASHPIVARTKKGEVIRVCLPKINRDKMIARRLLAGHWSKEYEPIVDAWPYGCHQRPNIKSTKELEAEIIKQRTEYTKKRFLATGELNYHYGNEEII